MAGWEHSNLVAASDVCRVTVVLREKGDTGRVTVCGAENRLKNVYTSKGSTLEVRILGSQTADKGYFLLKYESTWYD